MRQGENFCDDRTVMRKNSGSRAFRTSSHRDRATVGEEPAYRPHEFPDELSAPRIGGSSDWHLGNIFGEVLRKVVAATTGTTAK